ncbi:hypothetical protein AcW2_001449 [Taiwanofungus camphoratus]|nr:hypothetical protein AcW2_001449 [Antrodia cinnamomea]
MPPMAFAGLVTKAGFMNKTATVTISRWVVHPKTGKVCNRNIIYCLTVNRTNYSFHVIQRLERSKKFLTHDENNQLREGDTVLIRNCPPVSARKRFKLEKILKSPETERDEMHARMAQMAQIGGGGPSRQSMDTQSTTAS